ncbi:MAG: HAD hydrolase-like protein [Nanoarchaeota archaeon]|nr:HAD hydrolase-like protein [Nanoarchaeota archaeon]
MVKNNLYDAVLFDVDGTLVYTLPGYMEGLVGEVLSDLGKKTNGKNISKLVKEFWFKGDREVFLREKFGVDPDLFWSTFREHDPPGRRMEATRAYYDVWVINHIRKMSIKTGIVTGAPREISMMNLGLLKEQEFDVKINAYDEYGVRAKPNPHGIELCLDILGVKPERAMYVGNGDEDIFAARAAGVDGALILRGDYEFPNLNPKITVYSLWELKGLIRSC